MLKPHSKSKELDDINWLQIREAAIYGGATLAASLIAMALDGLDPETTGGSAAVVIGVVLLRVLRLWLANNKPAEGGDA
jgi:hypothetical protein